MVLFLKQLGNFGRIRMTVYGGLNTVDNENEPCKQSADSSKAPESEHVEQFEAKFTAMMI